MDAGSKPGGGFDVVLLPESPGPEGVSPATLVECFFALMRCLPRIAATPTAYLPRVYAGSLQVAT